MGAQQCASLCSPLRRGERASVVLFSVGCFAAPSSSAHLAVHRSLGVREAVLPPRLRPAALLASVGGDEDPGGMKEMRVAEESWRRRRVGLEFHLGRGGYTTTRAPPKLLDAPLFPRLPCAACPPGLLIDLAAIAPAAVSSILPEPPPPPPRSSRFCRRILRPPRASSACFSGAPQTRLSSSTSLFLSLVFDPLHSLPFQTSW
ncbi:hypothetical protein B296_00045453 [Ensete ventricosum]|uniref:Uncharacterized protein n=1 Tax=Ensete ventricosum TaxID=4639 RepID=A0A426X8L3_ENSVE|nr:hypothetical protein B296_00045453 [Ensete ventricosum]